MAESSDNDAGRKGEDETLNQTAKRALWWSIGNNIVGRVGTTLMGIVLARILVPEDYGVYAVALVALNALLSMNELGVSLAIVRWPKETARIAPTVKTLALTSSVVLWVLMMLAAPLVAKGLETPEATTFLRILTLSVLIDAVTSVPAAVMTRDFLQKERFIVDALSFVVGSSLAIILALLDQGAWALVWSTLIGNIVNAGAILYFSPDEHPYGWDSKVARELLGFGAPLAVASLVIMALLNIDYVIVGAHLGPEQLGFYLLAFNLCMWPVNMFSAPARRVSLPLFARLNAGDQELTASAAFVPVCSMLLLVTLPACVLIAAFADPIIHTVYGDTWGPAAGVLPWLMVLALFRVLGELVYDFLVAMGRSTPNLWLQVLWLAALGASLPFAVRADGIEGVAMAHAAVAVCIVLPSYIWVLRRAGVSMRAMAQQLFRPIVGTVVGAGVGVAAVVYIPEDITQMVVGGIAIVLLYVVIVYPMRAMLKSSMAAT